MVNRNRKSYGITNVSRAVLIQMIVVLFQILGEKYQGNLENFSVRELQTKARTAHDRVRRRLPEEKRGIVKWVNLATDPEVVQKARDAIYSNTTTVTLPVTYEEHNSVGMRS